MCCVLFVLKCALCVELMWCVVQILFESECRCIRRKQGRHTEQLRQWEIQFYRIIIDGLNSFYRMRSRVQDTATPVLKRAWRRHIHCWSMWCRTSSDEPAPIKLLIRIEWVFLLRFFALTLSAVGHIWVASDLQCSAECVFVCDLCVCVWRNRLSKILLNTGLVDAEADETVPLPTVDQINCQCQSVTKQVANWTEQRQQEIIVFSRLVVRGRVSCLYTYLACVFVCVYECVCGAPKHYYAIRDYSIVRTRAHSVRQLAVWGDIIICRKARHTPNSEQVGSACNNTNIQCIYSSQLIQKCVFLFCCVPHCTSINSNPSIRARHSMLIASTEYGTRKKKHTQTHSWCIGAWWSVVRHRRSNWLQWLSMFTMPNCESTLNCVPLQFIHCFFVPYSKLNSQYLEWNWEDNNKIILFCMHNKYIFQGPILKCAASAHRNGAAAYSTISVFSESKQKNWFFGLPICVAIAVPAFRCFFASFHSISASVFMEYSFFLSVAVASICIAFKFSSIDREQRHNIHRHSWSSWTSRHTSSFVMRRWHSHSSHTHNTETVFARDEYVRRAFFFLMHLFGCRRAEFMV